MIIEMSEKRNNNKRRGQRQGNPLGSACANLRNPLGVIGFLQSMLYSSSRSVRKPRGSHMPASKPPITGYDSISCPSTVLAHSDFERLCLVAGASVKALNGAEHLGAAGSEQGRDIIAWREGEQWAFQCKRANRLPPPRPEQEIQKLLESCRYGKSRFPGIMCSSASCLISSELRAADRQGVWRPA